MFGKQESEGLLKKRLSIIFFEEKTAIINAFWNETL